MVEQSTNNILENVYKFNGKELDTQTGYYYYGARYYDPGASVFLSVDPHAEKYPNINPYVYVANNPINAIDPDGRDIVIVHRNSSLKYENGKLYNENGSAYTGRVRGFLQKTLNALETISKSSEGLNMVSTLQSSNNTFKIEEGSSQFNASNRYKAYANQIETDPLQSTVKDMKLDIEGGSGGVIQWNTSGIPIQTSDGMKRDAVIDLAHEMFHALDANNGMLDDRRESGVKRSEWQATYRENILRGELGKPLRTNYRHSVDENGVKRGIEPSMLDSSNKNVKPVWYQ